VIGAKNRRKEESRSKTPGTPDVKCRDWLVCGYSVHEDTYMYIQKHIHTYVVMYVDTWACSVRRISVLICSTGHGARCNSKRKTKTRRTGGGARVSKVQYSTGDIGPGDMIITRGQRPRD
jgi:hypothetical protein